MKRVQYDRIRTLDELRSERHRVDAELHRISHCLTEDREKVSDLFTPAGMFTYLGSGVDRICTTVQWCLSGYDFVRSLIDRIRTGRKRTTPDNT